MSQDYWWHLYGPFEVGEDDLPHTGQVISHYMKLSGVKTNQLAQMLTKRGWKVGERRMEQLMSQDNVADPQHISRRKLLIQALAIPPVLLGISHLATLAVDATLMAATPGGTIGRDGMLRYESALATYWDSFYSSSVQKHGNSIERWCLHLEELAKHGNGEERTQVITLLCRFKQLAAVAARDRAMIGNALHHHNDAVDLAFELNNAELIAASLIRRAKTLAKTQRVDIALDDVKRALPYANRSRDNLRGYSYQATAQLIAQLPRTRETIEQYQRYMDAAGRLIRSGKSEDDGSYMRLTSAGYHQDRARGYLQLGQYDDALDAIAAGEKGHRPDMTRWQAEFSLLRAEAYAQMGELEWACSELEEALRIADATHSEGKREKAAAVYSILATRNPNQPAVRHLRALLKD